MKPPHHSKPSSSSKISEKGPPHHLNESSSSDGILITVFFRIHCESCNANARSIYCVCRYNCRPNFVGIRGMQREKHAPEKNTLTGRRHLGWGGSGSSSSLSPVWNMALNVILLHKIECAVYMPESIISNTGECRYNTVQYVIWYSLRLHWYRTGQGQQTVPSGIKSREYHSVAGAGASAG